MVFGGSWGSTLSLAYAQTHPESVGSLVLRGIFTVRAIELSWNFKVGGSNMLHPDVHEEFVNFIPEDERGDLFDAYHKRIMSDDTSISHPAATAWNKFEILHPVFLLPHARMEAHYFKNKAFLEEGQLIKKENIDRIRHIPTTIVQGRYDVVCPPASAWALHKAFPESKLHWIPDAGHAATVSDLVKYGY
jgi:proline iminopeptidase